jgi:hypothetical protein
MQQSKVKMLYNEMPTKNLPKKNKLLQKIGCKVAESTYICTVSSTANKRRTTVAIDQILNKNGFYLRT